MFTFKGLHLYLALESVLRIHIEGTLPFLSKFFKISFPIWGLFFLSLSRVSVLRANNHSRK